MAWDLWQAFPTMGEWQLTTTFRPLTPHATAPETGRSVWLNRRWLSEITSKQMNDGYVGATESG